DHPQESYEGLPHGSPRKGRTVQFNAERFFYRAREIRDRARLINERIQPDLVLCLHFNAEGWGDPAYPNFVGNNHLHLLCNGAYSRSEFGLDDVRFEMMLRLLARV
ncbi:MAG: hypothetical protein ACC661_10840, partial [Verrucomicrobiales bacterium]